ncbi:unnamed protein product [Lactuca virosa]|uniref:DUF4218 domain-containing protein n=1 Tax=Lactuca virosa TaxID=75947 RepID=A0AAU9NTJ4_9ASTR|nr:unnamed protein product [Lactuca virosa]
MKSHDCHVFMQRLLPIAFREMLPKNVWEAVTEISLFFKSLTSTVITIEDMKRIEAEIPIILCKLKTIFVPGFFDSMEHLPIHLPYEAMIAGPVQYRWMYPFERFLHQLKKDVKNKARVEGSICNAYLVPHSYILVNEEKMQPYLRKYEESLKDLNPDISEDDLAAEVDENFATWFQNYARQNEIKNNILRF